MPARQCLSFCLECLMALRHKKLPRYALANHLFCGTLPAEFQDLTWIEEMVCSIYRNTAFVTRLYQSTDPSQPTVFKGNTCAHEMNVLSTASVLPRTPTDINDLLSVVFIGPGRFLKQCLAAKFRIRKLKVWSFLKWLQAHNPLYYHIPLSLINLEQYPDDGILPGVEERVILNESPADKENFVQETAGLDDHPADQVQSLGNDETMIFLEQMGVSDPECVRLQGRSFTAAALRKLIAKTDDSPDLIIHHGKGPVSEYSNPKLFPGMYPTLFPLGIGGFEDPNRRIKLGFQPQAVYFIDLHDKAFRSHHSFIFVALNIYHRRLAHIHTSLTTSSTRFDQIAEDLISISPSTLNSVANHLEEHGKVTDLSAEQKKTLDLLKYVNTVSGKIPGSEASRLTCRNEILSYCASFGVPTLYFTANPSPSHSPLFQVMWGDTTVDLSKQFPKLVNATERAMRLAQDPVAAADFFEKSISLMFDHLFGWDFAQRRSKRSGGILGHVQAFYGTTEYTERGSLHGHFLIWLFGALNPSLLHQRLKENPSLDEELFHLFDNIIHHHLPDIEIDVPSTYEPRIERPPVVPDLTSASVEDIRRWQSEFETEFKKCGESLQRHKCRPVCHKYGNENTCRFQFPHKYEPNSYFDVESSSVTFRCLDPTINYFNPFILVFSRHNHDLRCLLSGKAAKAAMYYITDYITKGELKTHHLLSLLAKGVINAQHSYTDQQTSLERSKTLLHKCLSQFSQQRQIHGQQAARYLRGLGDSIQSHETVPMLTSALLSFVNKTYFSNVLRSASEFEDGSPNEPQKLRLMMGDDGQLQRSNQIDHYYYRDLMLKNITFYDFVARFKVEKSRKPQGELQDAQRLGTYKRYALVHGHPMSDSHCIVEVVNISRGDGLQIRIPRVIGANVPRKTSDTYKLFMLAHFKPFSRSNPLIKEGENVVTEFSTFTFSGGGMRIMDNWEAMHECEDERDAERIRKQTKVQKDTSYGMGLEPYTLDDDNSISFTSANETANSYDTSELMLKLVGCNYFSSAGNASQVQQINLPLPNVTTLLLNGWKSETKQQEKQLAANRRQSSNQVNTTLFINYVPATENAATLADQCMHLSTNYVPPTETSASAHDLDATQLLSNICSDKKLNRKQTMAFYIIARAFIRYVGDLTDGKMPNVPQLSPHKNYLRLLMTGPGGTGKSYVVKAIHRFMEACGYGDSIRFVAPTGNTAINIEGQTIHKAFFIKIFKPEIHGYKHGNTYPVSMSPDEDERLKKEWDGVHVLMIDEVSLLDQELLCQMDQTLRLAKKNDEYFGGIIVIFAGDFFQYPPVAGNPLYKPISNSIKDSGNSEFKNRMGRVAWRSLTDIVVFDEQYRMRSDPQYADAVNRLRKRECTFEDVDLFNSRIIKSTWNNEGVDVGSAFDEDAAVIVRTNKLRHAVNARKATAMTDGAAIECYAYDTMDQHEFPREKRLTLLHTDFSKNSGQRNLPALLLFYIGMPVILKHSNISTELGIVNGAAGILRQLNTKLDENGLTVMTSAIVEFPHSFVNLQGLPPNFFPLTPEHTMLSFKDGNGVKKFKRTQAPFEPAFGITGHGVQGQTRLHVIADLHDGGFASYVAASRPTSQAGLAILRQVSQDNLNKPLPFELLCENERHELMAENTMITSGFMVGVLRSIPDVELEKNIAALPSPVKVVLEKRRRKRISGQNDAEETERATKKKKKL